MMFAKFILLAFVVVYAVQGASVQTFDLPFDDIDDVTENQDMNEDDTALAIQENKPDCPCPRCSHVAFMTSLKADQEKVGSNQVIVFDNILINTGDVYCEHHGVFTAPRDGLYEFSSTIMSHGAHVYAEIMHEGKVVARIHAYANGGYTGTQNVIIKAKKGEEVWVRNSKGIASVRGDLYSTFSGRVIC